jgi:hypothetical protein
LGIALAEFQYRFNRSLNLKNILTRLLNALVAAPPSPERWLRTAVAYASTCPSMNPGYRRYESRIDRRRRC